MYLLAKREMQLPQLALPAFVVEANILLGIEGDDDDMV